MKPEALLERLGLSCDAWLHLDDAARMKAVRFQLGTPLSWNDARKLVASITSHCDVVDATADRITNLVGQGLTVTPTKARSATYVPTTRTGTLAPLPVQDFNSFVPLCPSSDEVDMFTRDFRVVWGAGTGAVNGAVSYYCDPRDEQYTAPVAWWKALSLARWVRFDAPLPLINKTDLYGYLRELRLTWRIGEFDAYNSCWENTANILAEPMTRPDFRWNLPDFLGMLVHESRHSRPGGGFDHPCESDVMRRARLASNRALTRDGSCDPSLAWGGAWALEYHYWIWMRDHTPGQFSNTMRAIFSERAEMIRTNNFCG